MDEYIIIRIKSYLCMCRCGKLGVIDDIYWIRCQDCSSLYCRCCLTSDFNYCYRNREEMKKDRIRRRNENLYNC